MTIKAIGRFAKLFKNNKPDQAKLRDILNTIKADIVTDNCECDPGIKVERIELIEGPAKINNLGIGRINIEVYILTDLAKLKLRRYDYGWDQIIQKGYQTKYDYTYDQDFFYVARANIQ